MIHFIITFWSNFFPTFFLILTRHILHNGVRFAISAAAAVDVVFGITVGIVVVFVVAMVSDRRHGRKSSAVSRRFFRFRARRFRFRNAVFFRAMKRVMVMRRRKWEWRKMRVVMRVVGLVRGRWRGSTTFLWRREMMNARRIQDAVEAWESKFGVIFFHCGNSICYWNSNDL